MVRTVHTNHFYELLAQISDPKIEFLTKTHFLKMAMSTISENLLFGQKKKAPAGWLHSKTKVVNTFPTVPDPNRTKISLKLAMIKAMIIIKNVTFISNLMNIENVQ